MNKAVPVQQASKLDIEVGSRMFGSLLFASGGAGLIFQVLWIKQLSLVVGIDVYAVTTAVSAFFAGLALGSAWFGRKSDRAERPVLLYGLLELGIGLGGVATTLALAHSGALFVVLSQRAWIFAWHFRSR